MKNSKGGDQMSFSQAALLTSEVRYFEERNLIDKTRREQIRTPPKRYKTKQALESSTILDNEIEKMQSQMDDEEFTIYQSISTPKSQKNSKKGAKTEPIKVTLLRSSIAAAISASSDSDEDDDNDKTEEIITQTPRSNKSSASMSPKSNFDEEEDLLISFNQSDKENLSPNSSEDILTNSPQNYRAPLTKSNFRSSSRSKDFVSPVRTPKSKSSAHSRKETDFSNDSDEERRQSMLNFSSSRQSPARAQAQDSSLRVEELFSMSPKRNRSYGSQSQTLKAHKFSHTVEYQKAFDASEKARMKLNSPYMTTQDSLIPTKKTESQSHVTFSPSHSKKSRVSNANAPDIYHINGVNEHIERTRKRWDKPPEREAKDEEFQEVILPNPPFITPSFHILSGIMIREIDEILEEAAKTQ